MPYKNKLSINAVIAFTINIASTIILLVSSIAFARILGSEQYGIFIYIMSVVSVLGIPVSMGMRDLLVRECATLSFGNKKNELTKLYKWSSYTCFVSFSTIFLLSILTYNFYYQRITTPETAISFFCSLPMLFCTSQLGIRYGILRGLDKIAYAHIPEQIIKPILQLTIAISLFFLDEKILPHQLVLIVLVSQLIALLVSRELSNKYLISKSKCHSASISQSKLWLKKAFPFILISGLYMVNNHITIIMLGHMRTPNETAIYRIASYGAEFISFILLATNVSIAPSIARYWKQQQTQKLQHLITKSIRTTFLISLIPFMFLLIFSEYFLSLYGTDFVEGSGVLQLLCFAQLLNIALGPVGLILNMSNNEKFTVVGVGIATVTIIFFNFALIPIYGIYGAAISNSLGLILWNILLLIAVRQTTGIRPSILEL